LTLPPLPQRTPLHQLARGISPSRLRGIAASSAPLISQQLGVTPGCAARLIALARLRPALEALLTPASSAAALLAQLRAAGCLPAALGATSDAEALALLAALFDVPAAPDPAHRAAGWPVWRLGAAGLSIALPERLRCECVGQLLDLCVEAPSVAHYKRTALKHQWQRTAGASQLDVGCIGRAAPLWDQRSDASIAALALEGGPAALFVDGQRVWRAAAGATLVCVFDHDVAVERMSGGFVRHEAWGARHAREIWTGQLTAEGLTAWLDGAMIWRYAAGASLWPRVSAASPPTPAARPLELSLRQRLSQQRRVLSLDEPLSASELRAAAALELGGAPWASAEVEIGAWRQRARLDGRGEATIWLHDEQMRRAADGAPALVISINGCVYRIAMTHVLVEGGGQRGVRLVRRGDGWEVQEVAQVHDASPALLMTPRAAPWEQPRRVAIDAATMLLTMPEDMPGGVYDVRVVGASAGVGAVVLEGAARGADGALGEWFQGCEAREPARLREALLRIDEARREEVLRGLMAWRTHHRRSNRSLCDAMDQGLMAWRLVALLRVALGAASERERTLEAAMHGAPWHLATAQDLWRALELAWPLSGAQLVRWLGAIEALGAGLGALAAEVWRVQLPATLHIAPAPLPLIAAPRAAFNIAPCPHQAPLTAAEAAQLDDPCALMIASWAYALHRERLGAPAVAGAHKAYERLTRGAPALLGAWLDRWAWRERQHVRDALAAHTSWPQLGAPTPMRG
jgi:hypothetical protein